MGVTLLCRLGYWQLSRGQEKQQLLSQWDSSFEQRSLTQEALLTASNQNTLHAWRYRKVSLKGEILNENTILLDNKINQGRAGYHVLSPILIHPGTVILIDRGWVPLSHRAKLPTFPAISGIVTIEGYLDFAYRNPFVHQSIENSDLKWPLRVQQLDYPLLAGLLNKSIIPMLVKLSNPSSLSFDIPPARGEWLSPERHYGYAAQWFLLALTLFASTLFYYFRRARKGNI